ncbi:hypothetical protein JCM10213_007576 [Rhodosporidiobolus nylandii]
MSSLDDYWRVGQAIQAVLDRIEIAKGASLDPSVAQEYKATQQAAVPLVLWRHLNLLQKQAVTGELANPKDMRYVRTLEDVPTFSAEPDLYPTLKEMREKYQESTHAAMAPEQPPAKSAADTWRRNAEIWAREDVQRAWEEAYQKYPPGCTRLPYTAANRPLGRGAAIQLYIEEQTHTLIDRAFVTRKMHARDKQEEAAGAGTSAAGESSEAHVVHARGNSRVRVLTQTEDAAGQARSPIRRHRGTSNASRPRSARSNQQAMLEHALQQDDPQANFSHLLHPRHAEKRQ